MPRSLEAVEYLAIAAVTTAILVSRPVVEWLRTQRLEVGAMLQHVRGNLDRNVEAGRFHGFPADRQRLE